MIIKRKLNWVKKRFLKVFDLNESNCLDFTEITLFHFLVQFTF
jgi:hypothetical protein